MKQQKRETLLFYGARFTVLFIVLDSWIFRSFLWDLGVRPVLPTPDRADQCFRPLEGPTSLGCTDVSTSFECIDSTRLGIYRFVEQFLLPLGPGGPTSFGFMDLSRLPLRGFDQCCRPWIEKLPLSVGLGTGTSKLCRPTCHLTSAKLGTSSLDLVTWHLFNRVGNLLRTNI